MADVEITDVVGVMRVHLQEVYSAVDWALGQNEAFDIADSYRQGTRNVRSSRITAALSRAHSRLEAYLEVPETDDHPEEETD